MVAKGANGVIGLREAPRSARPWVLMVDEADATGDLAEAYARIAKQRGKVANVVKANSLLPAVMERNLDLYAALMYGEHALPRADRELVAVEVSRGNCADYCVSHHAAALARVLRDERRVATLVQTGTLPGLTPRQKAMLSYARKLAHDPGSVGQQDVQAMRDGGLSDEEIVAVNHIVGYFCLMNRVVLGLGVPLESDRGADAAYKY